MQRRGFFGASRTLGLSFLVGGGAGAGRGGCQQSSFYVRRRWPGAGPVSSAAAGCFRQTPWSVQLQAKPWKRCLQDTDEGHAGTGGIYKNEERLRKYDFSEALFVERMAVYYPRAKPLVFEGLESLYGKRVGVARGWSYGDAFDKAVAEGKVHAEEVSADAQNFHKLAAGRLDAVLAIEAAGHAQLRQPGLEAIEKSPRYLFENPTYLAFAKTANQGEVLAAVNAALVKLRRQGDLDALIAQELGQRP